MTEKEALEILTGNREDYNSYARALHIAIKVLRAYVADILEYVATMADIDIPTENVESEGLEHGEE